MPTTWEVLDEKRKIWKLRLTWKQIDEEQRMRGAFRIFIDENMRREKRRDGGTPPILSPPHACWTKQISIRGTTVLLFGVTVWTKTVAHVAVDHIGESWPFVLWASMIFREPNNKRYFQAQQCQKQSSATLNWWQWHGCGLRGCIGGNRGAAQSLLYLNSAQKDAPSRFNAY